MHNISSIARFHSLLSLPSPLHPLVSVIHLEDIRFTNNELLKDFTTDFYSISLKKEVTAKMKYGHQNYDFDKGLLSFTAPKHIQSLDLPEDNSVQNSAGTGYALLFHPDFLYGHPLASAIKNYGFFSYAVSEALHLSDKEEQDITDVLLKTEREYEHIDRHTQEIILSQIDLLLNYCKRFYDRQFITRKAANHDVLNRMENLMNRYFEQELPLKNGLPTVEYIAGQLSLTPNYLSDMLRHLTGIGAQQHIQDALVSKAKQYLSSTNLSVAEIAYNLGFNYPQSFNKMFKKKTHISPLEFRQGIN